MDLEPDAAAAVRRERRRRGMRMAWRAIVTGSEGRTGEGKGSDEKMDKEVCRAVRMWFIR